MPNTRSAHPSALQNALPVVQDIMQDRSMTLARFNTDSRLAIVSAGLTQVQLDTLARKVYTETRVSKGDVEDTRAVYTFLGLDSTQKGKNVVQAASRMLKKMKQRAANEQRVFDEFIAEDSDQDQEQRDLGQSSSGDPHLDVSTGTLQPDSSPRKAQKNQVAENPEEVRVPGLPSRNDFGDSVWGQKRFLEFLADARKAYPSLSEKYFSTQITAHFRLMDNHTMLSNFNNFYDDREEEALQKNPARHSRLAYARLRMKAYMTKERGIDVPEVGRESKKTLLANQDDFGVSQRESVVDPTCPDTLGGGGEPGGYLAYSESEGL